MKGKIVYVLVRIWNGYPTSSVYTENQYELFEAEQKQFALQVIEEFRQFASPEEERAYQDSNLTQSQIEKLFRLNKNWALVNEISVYEMVPVTLYVDGT
jgi:hypothetical protein